MSLRSPIPKSILDSINREILAALWKETAQCKRRALLKRMSLAMIRYIGYEHLPDQPRD
jgi:hypothetical protein